MALGSLIAGGLNYLGTKEQNALNREIMREQMVFQKQSVGEQMAFQERMSNTSYQRAVQDLTAAGLNPMLALGAGASTPAGASSAGSTTRAENPMSSAVSSAQQSRMLHAQLEQVKEQNKLLDAQRKLLDAELPEKQATGDVYKRKSGKILKIIQETMKPLEGFSRAVSPFQLKLRE